MIKFNIKYKKQFCLTTFLIKYFHVILKAHTTNKTLDLNKYVVTEVKYN